MKKKNLFLTAVCCLAAILFSACEKEPSTDGQIDGHGYVDLGLSVKWATCNVGATAPEQCGGYYAWGETAEKAAYKSDNHARTTNDAAKVNWDGAWRTPTREEMDELCAKCEWTWTTRNGVNGFIVTGKKAGYKNKAIFLPSAGVRNDSTRYFANEGGYYWANSLYDNDNAYYLSFTQGEAYRVTYGIRCGGLTIRPVCE